MAWNVTERVYSNPEWRKTLLETPSGFALFDVSQDALKKADDIWVYFKDVDTAKNALFALGFVKFDDKSIVWDGGTQPSKDLIKLIRRFCTDEDCLLVQNANIKDIVMKKLDVKCSYDHNFNDEVIWGIKNVLHGFIPEEEYNITREYRLPPSKGLQQCLLDYLIHVSEKMLNVDFIADVGLLRYLDITLEKVPKMLREKFDEHVCKIGEKIEDDLKYAKVVAKILVPELSPNFDFKKMFTSSLAQKVQKANKCATQYRNQKLSMSDRELIMGSLSHLLVVPKQRDDLMIRVKLMEAQLRKTDVKILEDEYEFDISVRKHYSNLKHSTFRRVLLETPSGFAIFGVHEREFARPKLIWADLSNSREANEVVLALGFVKIDNKSIARNKSDGPGPELSSIIQKLCTQNTLIVQDDALKSTIEEKLGVQCFTKCSNDDDGSIDDLIWGLKYYLHFFVPQEMEYVTEKYYEPLSRGLQRALRSYHIVPQGPVNRKLVYSLGYLEHLTDASKVIRIIFRKVFNQHVPLIGELIKDDVIYAKVMAWILVPECRHKFDFKSLSDDVAEKVADVGRNLKESGKFVSSFDELAILLVLGFYETLNEKRQRCLQFLNSGCPQEELQRLEDKVVTDVEKDTILNEWLMLQDATLSDDDLDSVPDQLGDEVFGVKGTEGGKKVVQKDTKTIGKTESMKEKCVQGDELDPSCQYNLQTEIVSLEEDSSDKNLNVIHNGISLEEDIQTDIEGQTSISLEEDSSDKNLGISLEEDSSDKNLNAIHNEEFSSDKTESNQQSEHLLTDSSKTVSKVKGLIEYFNKKSVGTHDNLLKLADHPAIFGGAVKVGHHKPATMHSEPIEDGNPSSAAVSSEQLQEASVLPPVPEDGATLSLKIYEYEIQEKATGGGTSEQTNVVVSQQNGVAVTEEDGMTNTILGKSKPSENKAMQDMHSKTPDDVKPQKRLADLSISEDDNVDEQHYYLIAEEDMEAISSVVGSAVGAKVVSFGSVNNTTQRVCSFDVTLDDSMQENETSGTIGPSQVDITSTTSYEINTVGSTNGVERKQDEIDTTTNHKIDGACCIEFNDLTATDTAGNISSGTNMMCGSINEVKLCDGEITKEDDVHHTVTQNVENATGTLDGSDKEITHGESMIVQEILKRQ